MSLRYVGLGAWECCQILKGCSMFCSSFLSLEQQRRCMLDAQNAVHLCTEVLIGDAAVLPSAGEGSAVTAATVELRYCALQWPGGKSRLGG